MKTVLLGILIVCTACICFAEEFKSKEEITSFLRDLSPQITKGEIKQAFKKIKPYWPIPAHEVDAIVYQVETQSGQITSRLGQPLSMEVAKTYKIGKSFYREVYLLKYEKHAMCWVFTFYKPKNKWLVNSVVFCDIFERLFEEE